MVAFDLPGFGKSDKGSQEYSPTRYARLAHFLADRYFQNKAYHIVGHSMGGAIALRFAAQRPLRFQRLVLIDAAGILHPQVISKFQAGSLLERTSGVKQTRGFAERLSGKILEQVDKMPISPIDIANSALGRDQVLQGGPEKIAALELAGENFSYAIASVTEPTLILWGDGDLTVPLRTGQVLAARMALARLEVIADAAHEPMQDQTEQTNTLVRRHLLASEHDLAGQYQRDPAPARIEQRTRGHLFRQIRHGIRRRLPQHRTARLQRHHHPQRARRPTERGQLHAWPFSIPTYSGRKKDCWRTIPTSPSPTATSPA